VSTALARVDPTGLGGSVALPGLITTPRLAWAALFLNVLAFSGLPTLIPIPGSLGQLVTQGSLIVALLFALLANRSVVVRPNLFLMLLTLLAVVSLMASVHNVFLAGSVFRACRLLAFVTTLWLLTPWWGRADFALLRAHIRCLRIVLVTVLVGAVVAHGDAFSYGGRLSGALWPIPPTQVAHYSAVLIGCTTVLWFAERARGRTALLTLAAATPALLLTHTRTALLALVAGLAVAGASMFFGHARVRRTTALVGIVAVTAGTLFSPLIVGWLWRGQSLEEASQLTGRTKVWSSISALQRPRLEELFGSGLSNKSFDGLPIDSSWLSVYVDQGWFGTVMVAALLLVIVGWAVTHRRGARRALALFLVTYCIIASFTETGLGDASPYLMELVLAASLLAAPVGQEGR
jgi:O-antigen ligase